MSLYDIIYILLIYGGILASLMLIGLYIYSKIKTKDVPVKSNADLHTETLPSIIDQLRLAQEQRLVYSHLQNTLEKEIRIRKYYAELEQKILSKPRYTVLNEPTPRFYRNVSNF